MLVNYAYWFAGIVLGMGLGRCSFRIEGFIRKVYHRYRLRICWRFHGTGVIENREGTISEFCITCGHPYGYHH